MHIYFLEIFGITIIKTQILLDIRDCPISTKTLQCVRARYKQGVVTDANRTPLRHCGHTPNLTRSLSNVGRDTKTPLLIITVLLKYVLLSFGKIHRGHLIVHGAELEAPLFFEHSRVPDAQLALVATMLVFALVALGQTRHTSIFCTR